MTTLHLHRILASGAVALAFAAQAAPLYKVTDLGTFGGPESDAYGMARGHVIVGFSDTAGADGHARAFSWQGGRMTDLGGLTADGESFATDINASGQVSGYATASDFTTRAVIFDAGAVTDIAALRDDFLLSFGEGINAPGHVTGSAVSSTDYTWHAFVYAGDAVDLLVSGSMGHGINDRDQVIGSIYSMATMFDHGKTVTLGTLGGSWSDGMAINDAGEATGWAAIPHDYEAHAFVWRDGRMHDLGTLGGTQSQGRAINRAGVVVGWSDLHGLGDEHAFIASHGRMEDLNFLLDPASGAGWTLLAATGIDERGHIIGTGMHHGFFHAFELTPMLR
ncbi:MAG TPA: hypothetical protein VJN68_14365 [Burkholderiaceae bacterium]|nr:hypothetical protein [Burkholderiaceae bacterium]